jgi:hypothetical protein
LNYQCPDPKKKNCLHHSPEPLSPNKLEAWNVHWYLSPTESLADKSKFTILPRMIDLISKYKWHYRNTLGIREIEFGIHKIHLDILLHFLEQ